MPSDNNKTGYLSWFLLHSLLTSFFCVWTFGDSIFVLFLHELKLQKGQIGILLSLFPFCGLLALGFAPTATRLGRKRIFLICYGTRKLVIAGLLFLPWIVNEWGHTAALIYLSAIIAIFAVLRSLAETAFYPWSQEFIPNNIRGKIGAWVGVLGLISSALALLIAGYVIERNNGLNAYMMLIAVGAIIGILSVVVMLKVPGGIPVSNTIETGSHLANMREALHDRNFTIYLTGMTGLSIGAVMLISFLPLYLTEEIGVSSATVVQLGTVFMVGGGISSLACGWLTDRVGSRPVLIPSAILLVIIPVIWIILPRETSHSLIWCALFYFMFGALLNGTIISATRLLYNDVIPPEKNTAYTAIHYAWMGVTGGIAPLLAGGILSLLADWQITLIGMNIDNYTVFFTTAMFFFILGGIFYSRVRPDDVHTIRTVVRNFLNRLMQR
ncbi:MFS transporter [bacterium AH-315-E10]|nr:MFS transporter [bacterium AH-315-E10]